MLARGIVPIVTTLAAAAVCAQQINRISGRGGESHRVEDATVLSGNGMALAGEQYRYAPELEVSATLSRIAPDGTPVWMLSMKGVDDLASGFGVRQLENDDLLFAFQVGLYGQAVARVTSGGSPLWVRRYSGGGAAWGGGAMETDKAINGEFGVIATSYFFPPSSDGQLLRVSASDGAVETNRLYSADGVNAGDVRFNDLDFVPSSNSDYFVTGSITRDLGPGVSDTDILVARIQRFSGAVVWCNAYSFPSSEGTQSQAEGLGIEFVSSQTLAVVAFGSNPSEQVGLSGSVHLRINPANGALLDQTFLPSVYPALASLDLLSSGNLLASGVRYWGDGGSFAQMWEINPADVSVKWLAEYTDRRTNGFDAVEHFLPDGGRLALVGSNVPSSIPSIGSSDQMFVQTDSSGDDGCSAFIWQPERMKPSMNVTAVALTVATIGNGDPFEAQSSLSVLETAIVCGSVSTCAGDLNSDGFVDDADFVIFVFAYNLLDCFDPSMPPGCPADLNEDDVVDDADFVEFVAAYNELVCP